MSRAQPFVHLHTHSHYSLLQALPQISALVKAAKEDGQTALALTDAGNLYGAIDFYKACEKEGIKPIIGVDAYVAARTRHDKEHRVDNRSARLVLLAKDTVGYKNLIKLVTKSYLEGFYYNPRIDRELLEQYHEGLIALIPSFAGEPSRALKENDNARAHESLAWYRDLFKDDCYQEITHHPEIEGHGDLMKQLIALATEMGVPLAAAHDTYYMHPEDALARELVIKIRTGERLDRELGVGRDDFSFISQARANELFKDLPEALENTQKIADACNVEINLGSWVFPNYPIPEGANHDEELRKFAYAGIEKRGLTDIPELRERLDYELSVIAKKGYSAYFLVVADLLRYARENGIFTNTRGSAAGSLVSYLCGITTVNPLEYQLPFERFLNPDRPSPPDIDMDIADNRRDDLIDYVRRTYGDDHVAQIGTFGTMLARAAVRDVARALGHSYSTGDLIAKTIPPPKQGFPVTIQSALKDIPELKEIYDTDMDAREIMDLAQKIEGNARHVGVHAAGVVISPTPATDFVPLQLDPKGGKKITQYDMHAVEDAGLLKFDFLGLTNLSVLADAVARVEKRRGISINVDTIPLDDHKTFTMLSSGATLGVFQFASSGMTNYLVELQPNEIHDLNAMVALYRPGPMAFIPEYIERKKNPARVSYLDPRMESILKRSYGIITYQDDVLMIAIELSGYSWVEADKFRKAIGKKIPEEMAAQKERFISGCTLRGMKPEVVQKLWDQIETFAAYGFNKCLTGDTRIVDADSGALRTIDSLMREGSSSAVYALTDSMKLTHAQSSRPFENGIKQVYTLTLRSGRTIRATDNHPFRTFDGWTPLGKLNPGVRIAVARRIPAPHAVHALEHYKAAALGYLISEGNLCHPSGVYFYSTQQDEIDDFCTAATQFPNTRITIDRSKSAASVYVGQVDPRAGNSLRAWITDLGLIGKTATEKYIPAVIFGTDTDSLAVFLGKLWQGDGCASVKNQVLFYATSSRRLAEDVQHLLLRFGIVSTIHTKQFRYRGTYKPGWTVSIQGADNFEAFVATIGRHLIGAKKKATEVVLSNSRVRVNNRGRGTSDTIPAAVFAHMRSAYEHSGLSMQALTTAAAVSERTMGYDSRKKGYTRAVLARIGDALDSSLLRMYAHSDIFWDEIVSIELDGEEMTYDLSVPGPANFVANGMIVHNSHAASYGNLAYKTAYMKANYTVDYMAALLTAEDGDVDEISVTVAECVRLGIKVLPPDVNESRGDFTVVDDTTIRFGLYSIKNFGQGIADAIIAERDVNGPYTDLGDLLSRVRDKNLNRKSLEALIQCGALDAFTERNRALTNIELLLAYHKEHMNVAEDQDSLFGALPAASAPFTLPPAPAMSTATRLKFEKDLLGLYVTGHPLDPYLETLKRQKFDILGTKERMPEGVTTVIGGLLESVQTILTKGGERMAFGKLADHSGSVEVVAFPRILKEHDALFKPERCVLIKGKMSTRGSEKSFVVEAIKALDENHSLAQG